MPTTHHRAAAPRSARGWPALLVLAAATSAGPAARADTAQLQTLMQRNNCTACHSADYIQTQPHGPKFKKDFWQAEVTKMIKVYGAPIDDADAGKIVEYLTATY